jgi:MarR-like DNA-binding transcriptional regulator SgrR of sgrS sRNA
MTVAYGETTSVDPSSDRRELNVIFPLRVLRPDSKLLNPQNTETTYEYYLLENLGAGLVRDEVDSANGYRGLIAESWVQVDPRTWVFTIRKDFRWSDGSTLTGEQLVAHFEELKRRRGRHLVNLARLAKAQFDRSKRALTLRFSQKTNESVLHELSLADAGVIHPRGDWTITSGPYVVKEYRPKERVLRLVANTYSPLLPETAPRTIVGLSPSLDRRRPRGLMVYADSSFA